MNYIECVPDEFISTGGDQITYIPSGLVTPNTIKLPSEDAGTSEDDARTYLIGTSKSRNVHFQLKDTQTLKKIREFNPIRIEGDKIKLSSERMEIGRYYPMDYSGKKYLFYKPKKGIIDIYEVME